MLQLLSSRDPLPEKLILNKASPGRTCIGSRLRGFLSRSGLGHVNLMSGFRAIGDTVQHSLATKLCRSAHVKHLTSGCEAMDSIDLNWVTTLLASC